jgi:hypothetical protein
MRRLLDGRHVMVIVRMENDIVRLRRRWNELVVMWQRPLRVAGTHDVR